MKLILTGASGFVAQELIAPLVAHGFELVLVTDRPDALNLDALGVVAQNCTVLSTAQAPTAMDGAAAVLHLAARNNDRMGSEAEFYADNVTATESFLAAAQKAGVPKFIFASSFHTITLGGPQSAYARTKAQAEDTVRQRSDAITTGRGTEGIVLHLATVYGTRFKGKLALLERLPSLLQAALLTVLGAFKPTLSVNRLTARISAIVKEDHQGPHYLSEPAQDNIAYRSLSRLMDLSAALVVAVLVGWLMLAVWFVIRLDSPGPGIFAQKRLARGAKPFTCYKFRTMAKDTEQAGTHEVSSAVITRTGHLLRKTKIDELPQVANLVLNQLSLVGPRPGLPTQDALRAARTAQDVFAVKPGITGLAQIQNIDMSTPEKLALVDAQYIAQQSLVLDFKIILATITGSGQGDSIAKETAPD